MHIDEAKETTDITATTVGVLIKSDDQTLTIGQTYEASAEMVAEVMVIPTINIVNITYLKGLMDGDESVPGLTDVQCQEPSAGERGRGSESEEEAGGDSGDWVTEPTQRVEDVSRFRDGQRQGMGSSEPAPYVPTYLKGLHVLASAMSGSQDQDKEDADGNVAG